MPRFPLEVTKNHHQVVFTRLIQEEWNNHRSEFAKEWRKEMFARKLVVSIEIGPDENLRRRVENLASGKSLSDLLKDFHLLEAALASDRRIVTLDKQFFKILRQIGVRMRELASLAVVNPVDDAQEPLKWLREGAPIGRKHRLMSRAGEA